MSVALDAEVDNAFADQHEGERAAGNQEDRGRLKAPVNSCEQTAAPAATTQTTAMENGTQKRAVSNRDFWPSGRWNTPLLPCTPAGVWTR